MCCTNLFISLSLPHTHTAHTCRHIWTQASSIYIYFVSEFNLIEKRVLWLQCKNSSTTCSNNVANRINVDFAAKSYFMFVLTIDQHMQLCICMLCKINFTVCTNGACLTWWCSDFWNDFFFVLDQKFQNHVYPCRMQCSPDSLTGFSLSKEWKVILYCNWFCAHTCTTIDVWLVLLTLNKLRDYQTTWDDLTIIEV